MPGPSVYSLSSYGDMIRCEPRMSAYAAALRDAITPGCTVIDLGAGPGVFSILACRYGAGKVIAIEPDHSIALLHQLARDNGCADRIEIVQGLSSDYHPAEKADVIVSDLRGGLPLFEGHIATIKDARDRFLAPGGRLIPARDQVRIAAVESAESYTGYDQPWRSNAYDVDLMAGSRFVVNDLRRVDLLPENLLGSPQHLTTLDYRTIVDPNLRTTVELPIERAGLIHGLLLWFDAELGSGAAFSNAPGEPPLVYRQTFLPLERPIAVDAGDHGKAEIKANLVNGSYIWSWNTQVMRASGDSAGPAFRQSTFLANIFQSGKLATHSESFVPARTDAVAIDALCLSLIDGERELKDIAEQVAAALPTAFANSTEALNRVTEVAGRYTRRD